MDLDEVDLPVARPAPARSAAGAGRCRPGPVRSAEAIWPAASLLGRHPSWPGRPSCRPSWRNCPWRRTSSRRGSCRPWTGWRTSASPTCWRSRSGLPWRCRSTFPLPAGSGRGRGVADEAEREHRREGGRGDELMLVHDDHDLLDWGLGCRGRAAWGPSASHIESAGCPGSYTGGRAAARLSRRAGALPKPPPPGVSTTNTSPGSIVVEPMWRASTARRRVRRG